MKYKYLIVSLLLLCSVSHAQFVQKVTSLNYYGAWGLNPTNLTEFNGKLYFFGTEDLNYSDYLMMTPDGSASGITVVKQIDTMKTSQSVAHLMVLNNHLIFSNQSQLWVSDGTTAGTVAIANLYVTTVNFVVMNNKIYFSAYTTFTYPINDQLYESDGTAAGTQLVKTINPSGGAYISNLYAFNGKLYFSASDGVNFNQLWISDGTESGTYMLKKLNPTAESDPTNFFGYNGRVYFNANDGVNGVQLWTSDGTTEGTVEITTINPTGPLGLNPQGFTLYNSKIFFSGYDIGGYAQLWSTDGTTSGTVKVKTDYTPRTYSGFANGVMAVYNGKLYVSGYDSLTATTQLWVSDGTTSGTTKVTHFSKGLNPKRMYAFQDKLIMTGLDSVANAEELFASDGTEAGTVCPTPPSTTESGPFYPWTEWVPFQNYLYFTACYTFWSDYQLCRYSESPFGIEDLTAKEDLSVYPNPTKGSLLIVLPKETNNSEIEIYNNLGILIYKQTTSTGVNKIDLSNQSPGIYILKMLKDNQTMTSQKIIKE